MEEYKKCSYCDAAIRSDADVCGFCREKQPAQSPGPLAISIYHVSKTPDPKAKPVGFLRKLWRVLLCGAFVALVLAIKLPRVHLPQPPAAGSQEQWAGPRQPVANLDAPVAAKERVPAPRVTLANYQRIRNGMTRREVEARLGSGTLHRGATANDPDDETFSDAGIPPPRPVIYVYFRNDRVIAKRLSGFEPVR